MTTRIWINHIPRFGLFLKVQPDFILNFLASSERITGLIKRNTVKDLEPVIKELKVSHGFELLETTPLLKDRGILLEFKDLQNNAQTLSRVLSLIEKHYGLLQKGFASSFRDRARAFLVKVLETACFRS